MRVLSIDLPWSADNRVYGFAACEVRAPDRVDGVDCRAVAARRRSSIEVFETYAAELGRFDLILLDHPIGGSASPGSASYRSVEHAFANAFSAVNHSTGQKIRIPRFQPGVKHGGAGLRIGTSLREALGTPSSIVVESFPQLSIGAVLDYAGDHGIDMAAVGRLKTHKEGPWERAVLAQSGYVATIGHFLRQAISITTANHRHTADAIDALLGLAVGVVAAGYRPPAEKGPNLWSQVYWLLSEPDGGPIHPSQVIGKARSESRAYWAAPLSGQPGEGRVLDRGILTLGLPPPFRASHPPLGL